MYPYGAEDLGQLRRTLAYVQSATAAGNLDLAQRLVRKTVGCEAVDTTESAAAALEETFVRSLQTNDILTNLVGQLLGQNARNPAKLHKVFGSTADDPCIQCDADYYMNLNYCHSLMNQAADHMDDPDSALSDWDLFGIAVETFNNCLSDISRQYDYCMQGCSDYYGGADD